MARVVLVVDSGTGRLIDVAGNVREGGRYRRFAKRMLSIDENPTLDYGANGGDTLTVSKGGGKGAKIVLDADEVEVTGDITVGGKTVSEIAAESSIAKSALAGKDGEVSVSEVTDEETGERRTVISLDPSVMTKLAIVDAAVGGASGVATKEDVASIADSLAVGESDGLEEVKKTLGTLISRMSRLDS